MEGDEKLSDLQKAVRTVRGQAMRANTLTTVQTENILFILLSIFMNYAGIEEFLCQKCNKPLRKILCIVQLQKQKEKKTPIRIFIYNHTRENKIKELRDPTMFDI